MTGSLDANALERSLEEILRRHEALRTTFRVSDGDPVQVIDPEATFTLPMVDLSNLPGEERETALGKLVTGYIRMPFNLSAGPLFHGRLVRLGEQDHILLLNVHHIAFDGWSQQVLMRELSALYAELSAGRLANLPDLPVQYADYAVWQREWFQGAELERQLAYWRDQLADTPALEIPTDRSRQWSRRMPGPGMCLRYPGKWWSGSKPSTGAGESRRL